LDLFLITVILFYLNKQQLNGRRNKPPWRIYGEWPISSRHHHHRGLLVWYAYWRRLWRGNWTCNQLVRGKRTHNYCFRTDCSGHLWWVLKKEVLWLKDFSLYKACINKLNDRNNTCQWSELRRKKFRWSFYWLLGFTNSDILVNRKIEWKRNLYQGKGETQSQCIFSRNLRACWHLCFEPCNVLRTTCIKIRLHRKCWRNNFWDVC
jgi:hypothetical protein